MKQQKNNRMQIIMTNYGIKDLLQDFKPNVTLLTKILSRNREKGKTHDRRIEIILE